MKYFCSKVVFLCKSQDFFSQYCVLGKLCHIECTTNIWLYLQYCSHNGPATAGFQRSKSWRRKRYRSREDEEVQNEAMTKTPKQHNPQLLSCIRTVSYADKINIFMPLQRVICLTFTLIINRHHLRSIPWVMSIFFPTVLWGNNRLEDTGKNIGDVNEDQSFLPEPQQFWSIFKISNCDTIPLFKVECW